MLRFLIASLMAVVCIPAGAHADAARFCPATVRSIDAAVADTLAHGSPGMMVAVAVGGAPVFVKGFGTANLAHDVPVRRGTVFKLASITKQFTAAAILLAVERGDVALGDTLAAYVPELPRYGAVTIHQLLAHTSGIADYAGDPELADTKAVDRTVDEMLNLIGRQSPAFAFEPGSAWGYSNSNYYLLGVILERVEQRPLAEIFAKRLFAPALLRDTAFDRHSDVVAHRAEGYRRGSTDTRSFERADWISPSIPGGAGGLRTTADDLLRWEAALFGGKVLSAASLARMIAPARLADGRTTRHGMPVEWREGLRSDYGMGVFVASSPAGRKIWHSGDIDGFTTWVAHYPDGAVTIALLANAEGADLNAEAIEAAVLDGRNVACPPVRDR